MSPAITPINGSSPTGRCRHYDSSNITEFTCHQPTTSVLCDGSIPTLSELDGGRWTNQLVTIRLNSTLPDPTALFTVNSKISRVEVVMFNCLQWEIGVQAIEGYVTDDTGDVNITTATVNTSSCDSLVRVCLNISNTHPENLVGLRFYPYPNSAWVHLAEVAFYSAGPCPSDDNSDSDSTSSSSLEPTPSPTLHHTGSTEFLSPSPSLYPPVLSMPATTKGRMRESRYSGIVVLWIIQQRVDFCTHTFK